jgi:hypothetical protein
MWHLTETEDLSICGRTFSAVREFVDPDHPGCSRAASSRASSAWRSSSTPSAFTRYDYSQECQADATAAPLLLIGGGSADIEKMIIGHPLREH